MTGWERTGTDDAPVWVLEWDHRPGLVVRCTVPSLRARCLSMRVAPLLGRRDPDHRLFLALAEVFAEDSLLGWNLTWGGQPRECSAAGIGRVDLALVAEILAAWIEAWMPAADPVAAEPEADPGEWAELDDLSVELDEPELAELVGVAGG